MITKLDEAESQIPNPNLKFKNLILNSEWESQTSK